MIIRENIPQYMSELKKWLNDEKDVPLEEMADFFAARKDGYEEHMSRWAQAYRYMSQLIPEDTRTLLDLGCGTGLELDGILERFPNIDVTGVDLSEDMLGLLSRKHPKVKTVCADYFKYDLGTDKYDTAVSFETLHHFTSEAKLGLFGKIHSALKCGGAYYQADYIACCPEEEELLARVCKEKRRTENIPDNKLVHFDTPLTAEHETELMKKAGFSEATLLCSVDGAVFIKAVK